MRKKQFAFIIVIAEFKKKNQFYVCWELMDSWKYACGLFIVFETIFIIVS